MNLTFEKINASFIEEDLEGLIEDGAPLDEYSSEAQSVAEALAKIPLEKITVPVVAATIALVWAKNFDRSAAEMAQRLPACQRVAEKLLTP
jgi:hypothetical protein